MSIIGRNTQGVKVIGVSDDEQLISVEKVAESDDDDQVVDTSSDDDANGAD